MDCKHFNSNRQNDIHALDGNAYKKHKDALANFNKSYVKTEIFPRSLGRKTAEAEEIDKFGSGLL